MKTIQNILDEFDKQFSWLDRETNANNVIKDFIRIAIAEIIDSVPTDKRKEAEYGADADIYWSAEAWNQHCDEIINWKESVKQ